MSYFQTPSHYSVGNLFNGILSVPLPSYVRNIQVSDIAYDARSLARFHSDKSGVKIYISPSPFINRECKEQEPNQFIDEAIKNGANIIIYKPGRKPIQQQKEIFYFKTDSPRLILSKFSGRWYGTSNSLYPAFGITGTIGKTTTAYILHHILNSILGPTALVSSADFYIGKKKYTNLTPEVNDAWLSCPESLELSGFFSEHKKILKAAIVETTSHALALNRASYNLNFAGGIITKIGSDHLDFHKTHKAYVEAKMGLLRLISASQWKGKKWIILNATDPFVYKFYKYAVHLKLCVALVTTEISDRLPKNLPRYVIKETQQGYHIKNQGNEILLKFPMIGNFNLINAAMAIALACQSFSLDFKKIVPYLELFPGVPGRIEIVQEKPFTVIIDNAHEEMSLEAILSTAKKHWNHVVTVFSCTGDRDRSKRQIMGRLAAQLSDFTIITNDSTHSEDPQAILTEIENGYRQIKTKEYKIIDDRREAITKGLKMAHRKGVVLILGMGSEKIIERGGVIRQWSDALEVKRICGKINSPSGKI